MNTIIYYIKKNIKLIILTFVAIVLIVFNSASIIENIKREKNLTISRHHLDHLSFYDNEFMHITLKLKNGKVLNIPDNLNHIIIGLNKQFYKDIETLESYMEKFNMTNYDIDIVVVSIKKDTRKINEIEVYNYNSVKFGEFFHLSNYDNFTTLVNNNNKIKFFKYDFLELRELELLLNRYKRNDN